MPTRQDGALRCPSSRGAAERELACATSPSRQPRYRELRSARLLFLAVPLAVASAAPAAAATIPLPVAPQHLGNHVANHKTGKQATRGPQPRKPEAGTHPTGEQTGSPRGPAATQATSQLIKTQFAAAELEAARLAAAETAAARNALRPAPAATSTKKGLQAPPAGANMPAILAKEPAPAGSVAAFGDAAPAGMHRPGSTNLVGVAAAHCGTGYWALNAKGHVFAYGCAQLYGSLAHRPPGGAAAIASAPGGTGYWVVSHDGDVYSFGGAHYYGSLGKTSLPGKVVGIAPTPSGHGYWLVTARGAVYSFGNARFFGSLGRSSAASPVVGIAPSPHAAGYWLATAGGGVFSFGGARFFGNGTNLHIGAVVTAVASPPSSEGYWLLSAKGRVYPFGHAPRFGWVKTRSGAQATSIAATPSGRGLLVTTDAATLQSSLATRTMAVSRQSPEQSPAGGPLRYLGTFMVTCYDLTGPTATGVLAGPQSVAVDPSVIALGTRIYVQGLGVRTADDTGGAIIGNHIDIWEPAYSTCANWGVQERPVYAVVGY